MRKSQLFIFVFFGWLATGCTGSSFSARLQDVKESPVSKQGTNAPVTQSGSQSDAPSDNGKEDAEIVLRANGPSPILSIGGVLIKNESSQPQINPQVHIKLKAEQVSFKNKIDTAHLEKIEQRSDFVQYGCDRNSATFKDFTKGLVENKETGTNSDSRALKAKVVLLCGKVLMPEAFVTVVADHFVMIGANYEPSRARDVGFFNVLVNEMTLVGSNYIISKGSRTNGIVMEGPSISLVALKAFNGKGTLDLKAVGGDLVAEGGR